MAETAEQRKDMAVVQVLKKQAIEIRDLKARLEAAATEVRNLKAMLDNALTAAENVGGLVDRLKGFIETELKIAKQARELPVYPSKKCRQICTGGDCIAGENPYRTRRQGRRVNKMAEKTQRLKFKVWCEFEINGKLYKDMAGPENWFLLTQTGGLMSHGPMSFDPNTEQKHKKLVPLLCSGYPDKHGIEITQGDILMPGRREVCFGEYDTDFEQGTGFYTISHDPDALRIAFSFAHRQAKNSEVIGNIHQHPELLKIKPNPQAGQGPEKETAAAAKEE